MAERTVLMVSTRKGLFLLESDDARQDWAISRRRLARASNSVSG